MNVVVCPVRCPLGRKVQHSFPTDVSYLCVVSQSAAHGILRKSPSLIDASLNPLTGD